MHRVASNDVDNFSVDNPLWITTAAGGRSLRGRRQRVCGGSVNAGTEVQTRTGRVRKSFGGRPKGMRRKCEHRHGNINADGAGAEGFAGDGCSQGASFVPMALISRRWRGGRIYNNTRTRELLRRKCVKPADLTTHSSPKTCSRPSTFSLPSRTLPLPHAAPTHTRRLRHAFLADLTTHSPPKPFARPRTATRPSRALPLPHTAPTHARRLRDAFPAESLLPPPQRLAASPSVPLRAQKNGTAQWMCDAECLGRPSLRSVIGVGEPRAVRRRCGALACRRGA